MSNISTNLKRFGEKHIHLSVCQSTNDELNNLIKTENQDLVEGFVVSTDFQTDGRGQKGNHWISKAGENLMFSIYLEPRFLSANLSFWLSASVALAVANVLEKYLPEVKVKWPNDLMVGSLKIGGILIENTVFGQNLDKSIIGIGLNINQTDVLSTATSLKNELKTDQKSADILCQLKVEMEFFYNELKTQGWEKIRQRYYKKLYKMAVPHDYLSPDGTKFRAVLKGISDHGELILITTMGEKRYMFKEVGF